MATIDVTDKQAGGVQAGARGLVVLSNEIDCSVQNVGAADVVQLIDIGPGDRVLSVVANVKTAEGAALTFDIGDETDPNGYMNAVDGNAVAISGSELALTEGTPNTVTAYSGGKLYTVADTIDAVFAQAADAAVIKVSALVARMG